MGFWRVCIVNNRKRWKYVGVLHEYIHLTEGDNRTTYLQGNYYIQANTNGERARDPLKYQKDAVLLSNAFNELPEDDDLRNRYAFYCANSYKDAGDYENAIEWYKKTINLNGWTQEKYRSCICLHNIYKPQNETEKAMYWAVKSLKFDKTRAEGVFKLVQHYCCEGQNDVAYMYYTMIQDWYENSYINDTALSGKLFADMLDFDFYLPYYMIIVSDNVGKKEVGVKMYNMIFTKKKMAAQWWIDNLLYNFQFFYTIIPKTDTEFISKAKEYLKLLEYNKYNIKDNFYRNLYELIS
jgi:tetratricopeptide (TPR) repeat protein